MKNYVKSNLYKYEISTETYNLITLILMLLVSRDVEQIKKLDLLKIKSYLHLNQSQLNVFQKDACLSAIAYFGSIQNPLSKKEFDFDLFAEHKNKE